jgi:hypothetical protein
MICARLVFLFAANQSFDSSLKMVRAIKAASKLCAEVPRHATMYQLSAGAVAQLGKGQGFAPPRCIPSSVPQGAAETVPVSTPFGICAGAFRLWAVRP